MIVKSLVIFAVTIIIVAIVIVIVVSLLNIPEEPTFSPTSTVALTATDNPKPPILTNTPTATSIPAPTPTQPREEVVIEVDEVVADDDRCQEADCGSSLRIEVKAVDSAGGQIQPAVLSYNWSFNPSDSHNENKLDSKNYAINYYVPCELDNQTITIEVLKNGKVLGVRNICFNIK